MQNLSTFHRELIILCHCLLLILHCSDAFRCFSDTLPFKMIPGALPPKPWPGLRIGCHWGCTSRLLRVDRALAALHAPCTLSSLTCTSTGSTSTSPGNFPKIRACTLALGTGCMVSDSKVAQTGTYKHFTVLRVIGNDLRCQKT